MKCIYREKLDRQCGRTLKNWEGKLEAPGKLGRDNCGCLRKFEMYLPGKTGHANFGSTWENLMKCVYLLKLETGEYEYLGKLGDLSLAGETGVGELWVYLGRVWEC